ncbi:MAG TPA: SDR family NAD(P)-dependent oxidoreductase [Rectinemataceae bacterium]|nr:SDR family NAD(P)-dependent oxidoreductase [Rectinemataceae bacterium]
MSTPQDLPPDRAAASGSLTGRRALIVGGSGGLGRAVALELARRGASLEIHGGSSRDRLDETLQEARAEALGEARVNGFLQRIERPADLLKRLPELGKLDILVCAFGPFVRKSLAATTSEDWERIALLDLALPGALASAFLPGMAERGWGRMLFFGGTRTDGIRAYASNAAYAAAKTGLAVLVKSLAAEGSRTGVACIALCPGLVDTEYLDENARLELRAKAPRGELLRARDIAGAAVALIAADPCAASGAVLTMDGGLAF